MFDKMKQMYDMQKKAKSLQKQLESIEIEKATKDGSIRFKVNGAQQIQSISIDNVWLTPERKNDLENQLRKLINDGFAEVQQQTAAQAAELMKELKGLNIPGL